MSLQLRHFLLFTLLVAGLTAAVATGILISTRGVSSESAGATATPPEPFGISVPSHSIDVEDLLEPYSLQVPPAPSLIGPASALQVADAPG